MLNWDAYIKCVLSQTYVEWELLLTWMIVERFIFFGGDKCEALSNGVNIRRRINNMIQ